MSKISDAFENKKALVAFITGGDPDIQITKDLIKATADAGADMIHIGIPFSDPVGESPAIQAAYMRALNTNIDDLLKALAEISGQVSIPLLLTTYINLIFAYGPEKFIKNCKDAGIEGVIVPDLPYEERDEIKPLCTTYGIELVSFIAPAPKDRLKTIAKEATGFLYCMPSLEAVIKGEPIGTSISEMLTAIRSVSDIPCVIGFGVSNPEQAKEMATLGDGIMVDNAIAEIIATYGPNSVPHVVGHIKSIRAALE